MNRWMLAILALLALAGGAGAQALADPERIDALVRKLGSSAFVQREQAAKELEAIGPAALPALRGAAKTQDAESARRIAELITRLEQQLLARQILTPKEYDWKIEAASVQEAIVALKEKTGYAIEVQENAGQLAAKKITITGKLPFWQALDKLCEQAGLVEIIFEPPADPAPPNRVGRGLAPIPASPPIPTAAPITLRPREKARQGVEWHKTKATLDVNGKSWKDALAWFSSQAKMPLVGRFEPPKGTVNFKAAVGDDGKPREYTLVEVFDIFNELLMKEHTYCLLRWEDSLSVVPADIGLGHVMPPRAAISDLHNHGRTEIVVVAIDLKNELGAEEFAPKAKRLVGHYAVVTPIPETNQILVQADVGSIVRVIPLIARRTALMSAGSARFVSHAGAVKTELRLERDAKAKEIVASLIMSPEPGLLNGGIAGPPVFTKWIDSAGRAIAANVDAPKQAGGRIVKVRFKDDIEKIKEMAGTLPLQVDLQNVVLAKMDKIMDAAGKSVAGANGGSLKVLAIKKTADDGVEIQIAMENLMPNPLGDNILINGNNIVIRGNVQFNGNVVIGAGGIRMNGVGAKDLPDLIDAKGQKFKIASIPSDGISISNGSSSRTATVVYQPNPGQAAPSELVFFGTRTHTIAVPFRFENVPLP